MPRKSRKKSTANPKKKGAAKSKKKIFKPVEAEEKIADEVQEREVPTPQNEELSIETEVLDIPNNVGTPLIFKDICVVGEMSSVLDTAESTNENSDSELPSKTVEKFPISSPPFPEENVLIVKEKQLVSEVLAELFTDQSSKMVDEILNAENTLKQNIEKSLQSEVSSEDPTIIENSATEADKITQNIEYTKEVEDVLTVIGKTKMVNIDSIPDDSVNLVEKDTFEDVLAGTDKTKMVVIDSIPNESIDLVNNHAHEEVAPVKEPWVPLPLPIEIEM